MENKENVVISEIEKAVVKETEARLLAYVQEVKKLNTLKEDK